MESRRLHDSIKIAPHPVDAIMEPPWRPQLDSWVMAASGASSRAYADSSSVKTIKVSRGSLPYLFSSGRRLCVNSHCRGISAPMLVRSAGRSVRYGHGRPQRGTASPDHLRCSSVATLHHHMASKAQGVLGGHLALQRPLKDRLCLDGLSSVCKPTRQHGRSPSRPSS